MGEGFPLYLKSVSRLFKFCYNRRGGVTFVRLGGPSSINNVPEPLGLNPEVFKVEHPGHKDGGRHSDLKRNMIRGSPGERGEHGVG
jgi:hypothetical protein